MILTIIRNNKFILCFLLGVIFFSWPAAAVIEKTETGMTADLSIQEKAAVDTLVSQYFDFLFSGDMVGLKNISTGELNSQIERLNTNPNYSEFLRKQYVNAKYEIIDYRLSSEKKLMVMVKITKDDGVESDFLIFIDGNIGKSEPDRPMKIEDAEKQ